MKNLEQPLQAAPVQLPAGHPWNAPERPSVLPGWVKAAPFIILHLALVSVFFVPVTTAQQAATCTILDLTIQPIDLFLLGLHLHTDTIHLVLTAQRGTLLGDLLCGLFFGQPTPGLLNQALQGGLITLA